MKRLWRWILVLAVPAIGGVSIWYATRPEPVEVVVKAVTRGDVARTVANTRAGTVKACRRARLAPQIGGQIVRLPVAKGERVKKGQLLLALWNDDLEAQRLLVERETTTLKARAEAVCLRAEVAGRNADRLAELRRHDASTAERLDNARAEAEALAAECRATRSEIKSQTARRAVVDANLARTRLTAPFDGVVAEIHGELFEYVTPSPLGIATLPVLDIIDPSCFYVVAPIDEVDAAGVRVGMAARISLDAFADRQFAGRVARIADYVVDLEKQARTVEVEANFIDLPNGESLLAGYSADIEVILEVARDVLRIPTEAVMDGRRVFLWLDGPRRLALREIAVGLSNWDHTEVRQGLSEGDRVVINVDHPDLTDGAAAVVIEDAP
jgi:HlyD family secretion protein